MLDRDLLERAIGIQAKSYRLLRWVGQAINDGRLPPQYAANHSNDPSAANDWLGAYFNVLPVEAMPERDQLETFANFYWTYIVSSFDIATEPGARGEAGSWCSCDLCVRMVPASHLRPKKLRSRDRARAVELMATRLIDLGAEHGEQVSIDTAIEIVLHPGSRRDAGFAAYGQWLINRLDGHTDGPSVLALWREIAWRRSGSPIQGFSLQLEDFVAAETKLLSVLGEDTRTQAR